MGIRIKLTFAVLVPAILLVTLLACSGGSSSGIPVTGTYVPELSSVDQMMKNILGSHSVPGGSLAIVKDGKLVYARGFGYADEDNKIAVEPSSVFRIASVTKAITTGMAATKLIENGEISLEDYVFGSNGILNDDIYSDIKDPRVYNIKVKHLLTHTAGFPGEEGDDPQYDFVDIAVAMGETPPASNVIVIRYVLSQLDLGFEPGSQYLYSNVGYNVLGRVIAKVSGMSYEDYVRSIIVPLGVDDVYIAGNYAADRRDNEVLYYDMPWCTDDAFDGSGDQVPCSYGNMNFPTLDSHGGWIASPTDLLRILTAIDGFDSRPDIFTLQTIEAMEQKPDTDGAATAYSGWGVDDNGNWSHSGALSTGTFSYMHRGENQMEMAVVFNRLSATEDNFMDQILLFMQDIWAIRDYLDTIENWPEHDLF